MAHDLFLNSAMAYAGEVPWHGLGVKLPRNATWADIKQVLPFYQAQERQLFAAGIPTPIPDRKALVASNDGRYLATVGADYGVVQFDDLAEAVMVAAGAEAVFHTAGLLGANGDRGWVLGELPNPIKVKGDESEIRKFFMATTAHDGAHAAVLANVATRVVCKNTLGAALGERDGARWSIRHTSKAAARVKAAGEAFKSLTKGYERFGELCDLMARTALSNTQRASVVEQAFPLAADASESQKANIQGKRSDVLRLAEQGIGVTSSMHGTAWALFNGLTEWADHHRPMRSVRGQLPSGLDRLDSQLFGPAADMKRVGLAAIRAAASF